MQKYPRLFVWAERIAIGVLALLPVFFVRWSFHPFSSPKTFLIIAAALVIIGLLVTLWIGDKSWKPIVTLPFIVFSAYIGWMIVASLLGESFSISWWGNFRLGKSLLVQSGILLYSFGILWIAQRKNIMRPIAGALALGSLGLTAYIYAALINTSSLLLQAQSEGGTMGNSSFAAAYLLAGIAGAVLLIITAKKHWKWVWTGVTVILITNPIFLNIFEAHDGLLSYVGRARAATLALALAVGIGFVFYHTFSTKKIIRLVANSAAVFGFMTLTFGAIMLYSPHTTVHQKFIEFASANRLSYQQISLQSIAVHPVFGVGFGHFPIVFQQFFDPSDLGAEDYIAEAWVSEPHNMILQSGVAGGIPATALYLVFFGTILFVTSRAVRKGALGKAEGSVLFAFFTAYMIQNVFLFDIPAAQMAYMALVALAASYSVSTADTPRSKKKLPLISDNNIRAVSIYGLWILVVAGLYGFVMRPFNESLQIKKLNDMRGLDAVAIFKTSPQGSIYDESGFIHDWSKEHLLNMQFAPATTQKAILNELRSYQTVITGTENKHIDFMRTHIAGAYTYLALFKASDYKDASLVNNAIQESMKAIALSPRNQIGYWLMAQSFAFAGDIDTGAKFAEMAVQLQPEVLDSHLVLLNILQYSDDKKLYRQQLLRAQLLFPEHGF